MHIVFILFSWQRKRMKTTHIQSGKLKFQFGKNSISSWEYSSWCDNDCHLFTDSPFRQTFELCKHEANLMMAKIKSIRQWIQIEVILVYTSYARSRAFLAHFNIFKLVLNEHRGSTIILTTQHYYFNAYVCNENHLVFAVMLFAILWLCKEREKKHQYW